MQGIHVIAVGTLKETFFADACKEYSKRLEGRCKLTVTEIPETKLPKNASAAQMEKALEAEGKSILAKISPRAHVAALCIEGSQVSSRELAQKFQGLGATHPEIAFVIGSSHGLSQAVKDRADWKLSMSRMTFPHQLARVMLLEQVYRGFSIVGGGKYHK